MPDDPAVVASPRSVADRLALAIATVGGAGRSPVAPGTAGSAVALLLLWIVPFSPAALVAFLVAVTLAGVWAGGRVERLVGETDPGLVVVDEIAGMTVSVLTLPRTPSVLLAAFVLFRVFDVVKPFPAGRSQRLPGGLGIMADDLVAGLYALLALHALHAVAGWP
jgi:phosphatidylglycerophosphatase A